MSRKDNTFKFVPVNEDGTDGTAKYIPIQGVSNLYCFGSLDANSAFFNFLGKMQISVHYFDYYEHYTGSFLPKEYLLSGKLLIAQAKANIQKSQRIAIAQKFVEGAAFNILKNLRYYDNRGKNTSHHIKKIESLMEQIPSAYNIDELMGLEGNVRIVYYNAFDLIINEFEMGNRTKRPPSNEINAMISFINSMCYTLCLDMIYHTQLNPTISFLHEPGYRRFSLALDISEIFKPIIVDRLIFSLLNKKVIQKSDFDRDLNRCLLKDSGRKKIVKAWDEKLSETIKHRSLKRHVSYRHLVKLECYKLVKHIMGMEEYKPFKAWW